MPRTCSFALVLLALLAAHPSAAPVRTRYDRAFYTPSEEVVTPHIAWARPYAAGPVKALFLIHRQNQREAIELAQRLQLDYTVFCAEDPGKFGETGQGVDAGWRLVQGNSAEELAAQLRKDLEADYDTVIVGNVKWDSFPLDCRYEILKKVKAGTGLVGYMPNGHDEHLDRVLEMADFRWAYANWTGGAQGVPDYFGIGDFVGAVDTTERHAGECAVRITGREVKMGSREPPRGGYYLHPVQVEPNTQYQFSAWYKAADGGQPSISLHPTPAGVPTPAGEGWQHTEVTWSTGDSTEFGIYLLNVAVGKVWYDDVSLVKVGEDTNLLPNPGFENPGPAPDLLTQGIPYPALPAFSGFSTPEDFARGVFQIAQFGQGRVALMQGFSVPTTQAMTPAPQGPMRTAQLDYDYYLAAAIKAILWGARKEPPVTILTPQPKLTVAHADLGALPPTFQLSGPGVEYGYTCTARSRTNESWAAGAGRVRLAGGQAGVSPALPSLPAGSYFLDLKLIPAAAVSSAGATLVDPAAPAINFASVALEVTSPVRINKLALDREALPNGGPVTGIATIEQPGENVTLEVHAHDNLGRLLGQGEFEADRAETPFSVGTLPACSIIARLEATLVCLDDPVDRQEAQYSVTDFLPDPHDLRHIVWTSPARDFISPYILREFRKHGVDTQYTNFSELVPEANLWHIPYAGRFADSKTDWYQPRPTREPGDLVRDPCLTDPQYRASVADSLTQNAQLVSRYSTSEFSLGDECHLVAGNWDVCMSPTCNADFREFLKREYADLAAVNAEWGTAYPSWDDVQPITLEEARRTGHLPQWVDHRRHMEQVWAGIYSYSRDVIQKVVPGARVGYEGSDTEVGSFHGNDYWQLAQAMDFNNIYYRDFLTNAVRDFSPPDMLLGAGWYGGYPGCRNEPYMRWFPWRALFKGSNSLWIWMGYGTAGGVMGYDLSLYPFCSINCDEVNEIKSGPGKLLIASQRQHDGVALLWSASSVHAAQITDGFPAMDATLNGLVRIVHDIGLECKTVSYQQLAEGQVTNEEFRVLLLPCAQALSQAEADAVRGFVEAGGTVIADLRPAVCDTHGRPYPAGLLDDLFGVKQNTTRFSPVTGDMPLPGGGGVLTGVTADGTLQAGTGHADGTVAGAPAWFSSKFGAGRAVLLNVSLAGYEAAERVAAASGEDFAGWPAGAATRSFVIDLLASGGVTPQIKITPQLPRLEVSRFRNGEAEYVGIVQGLPRDATEYTNQLATWPAAQPVTITFPRQAHVYDTRARKYLGRTDRVQTEIRPGIAKLYALLPYRVERLDLAATPPSQPGGPVSFRFRITTEDHQPEAHVVHLAVLDPTGREWECYRANILAQRGRGTGGFTPALNDPQGTWTIRARDAATGAEGDTKVHIARK